MSDMLSAHGVTVTVTTSAGSDGAVLVVIDTTNEPDGSDGGRPVRVLLNDAPVFAGVDYAPCDCSDDYGPCDAHGTTLAQREGASLRTSDELARLWLDDVDSIAPDVLTPYARDVMARVDAQLDDDDDGTRWLEGDLADELRDVVQQVESYGIGENVLTYWQDGYRIVRLDDGCPLLQA